MGGDGSIWEHIGGGGKCGSVFIYVGTELCFTPSIDQGMGPTEGCPGQKFADAMLTPLTV